MQRKYPKKADERKAIAWGVRNGLGFSRARELWMEGLQGADDVAN
jgi:hypothetical protein